MKPSVNPTPLGRIRHTISDGVPIWKLQCPGCGSWGEIDDDQLHGRVSVDHTDPSIACTFHETRDWWNTAERENQQRASIVPVVAPVGDQEGQK